MSDTTYARPVLTAERAFFLSMAGTIFLIIFSGFSQSVFLRPLFPNVEAAREPLFYVHGAIFFTWIALFITQITLIASGNLAWHRTLGSVGYVLIPLMLVIGLYGGLVAAHRPTGFTGVPDPPLHFLGMLVWMVGMFAVFAALGLNWRKSPQTHKRLMLLATIVLAEAGVSRWPIDFIAASEQAAFAMTALLLVPLIAWDVHALRRLHPATLWGGLAFLAYGPVRDWMSATALWQGFAKWAAALVA